MTPGKYNPTELLICSAARLVPDNTTAFVGTGIPMLAVSLAQRRQAPNLVAVFEFGGAGAILEDLPRAVGERRTFHRALSATGICDVVEAAQRGFIEYGFLGGAQIDPYGNLNTTVIGPYHHPKTRLPGSGGACEIAINARQVFVIMRQSARSFVERIDFRTSPGNLGGAEQAERIRREGGWLGRGPSVVVTDLGIWHFGDDGEMRLDSLHPGASLDEVRATIGWEPRIAGSLATTPAPTRDELRLIREELDPEGAYTK
jgi:acyl CoA:acetate/3-ketoacid CoA transferase beta subunit